MRLANGRAMIQVNSTTADILDGTADLSTWDDEELLRGQRRCQVGKFKGAFVGRPPKVVPMAIHHELNKRRMSRAGEVLRESLVGAVELWRSVLMDEGAPLPIRMEASKLIVDRVMGKAKESVDINMSVTEEPPWAVAIREMYQTQGPLKIGQGDVIDAEVLEDDPIYD
jgi:hypothetical protein